MKHIGHISIRDSEINFVYHELPEPRFVQLKNPGFGNPHWVKFDKKLVRICRSGKKKPYKNIPIYEGKKDENGNEIYRLP